MIGTIFWAVWLTYCMMELCVYKEEVRESRKNFTRGRGGGGGGQLISMNSGGRPQKVREVLKLVCFNLPAHYEASQIKARIR